MGENPSYLNYFWKLEKSGSCYAGATISCWIWMVKNKVRNCCYIVTDTMIYTKSMCIIYRRYDEHSKVRIILS